MIEKLYQAHINGSLTIHCIAKFATHLNPEKFNDDRTKLEVFFAQLNLKLQCSINHFIKEKQKMKQNKLSYTILRLEKDAFVQIKLYISAKNIEFKNVNQFVEVLKTCFSKVDLVNIAKHKLY